MTVLPIQAIHEIDQPLFGSNLFNLSALKRAGLPIPSGVVVSPPEFVIQTVISHFQSASKEVFEQKMILVKKELDKLSVPEEFTKSLGSNHKFQVGREYVEGQGPVWKKLVDLWLDQVKSKVWREGFNQPLNSALSAQSVFFVSRRSELVEACLDPESREAIIHSQQKLNLNETEKIIKVAQTGDKKLFLPQVYTFIRSDKEVGLIAVRPYTHEVEASKEQVIVAPQPKVEQIIKTTIKVFVNLTSGFANIREVDGLVMEAERFTHSDVSEASFEKLIFRLTEAASQTSRTVIFRLPDILTQGDVTGSLRLINQRSLLNQSVEAFNFVRNKKGLINVAIGVPTVKSSLEFTSIKRELASMGVTRKGLLQLWLEISVPENLINIEDYLEVGLDGVIINLDRIHQAICGYNVDESEFYKHQVKTLLNFLQPSLKHLHKNRIPILVTGQMTLNSDVLHFLIEQGVWGVVVNSILEAEHLPEHLQWVEKRVISKKLSTS